MSPEPSEAAPQGDIPASTPAAESAAASEPVKPADPFSIINAIDASGLLTVHAPTYLRTGPGDRFSRIAQLSAGFKVLIVTPGAEWHFVSHEGQFGYVPAGDIRPLIVIHKPSTVPAAPSPMPTPEITAAPTPVFTAPTPVLASPTPVPEPVL